MKRAGNLIERIAEPDNLRLAFLKASRGKYDRPDVIKFRGDLDRKLSEMQIGLITGQMQWGKYHSFKIYDPKERVIHAPSFNARVAHHAIMNICEPAFESWQIFDSYACRKEKGLDGALKRAVKFSRAGDCFIKMDIKKYFDTIDHNILKHLIKKRFKDKKAVYLFDSIIETYFTSIGKGVPIGNLTSQFFANHYLGVLDHHIKENLKIKRYVRYMDDFVIWFDSRSQLKSIHKEVETFLTEQLALKLQPVCLNYCNLGIPFLGYKVYPGGLRLSPRGRQRFKRKTILYHKLYELGIWNENDLVLHMEPLLAFIKRGASMSFRKKIFNTLGGSPEVLTV